MERNTSPRAAAPSKFIASTLEIMVMDFFLIVLMTYPLPFLSPTWFLTAGIAFFLSFMIEEDAHEQTIDLVLLFIVASLMFFLAVFHGEEQRFIKEMILGGYFFRFLLVITSLFVTCRSAPVAASRTDGQEAYFTHAEKRPMGYLPIFAFVFVLYLSFGEEFAPFVFSQASFMAAVIVELVNFYPALPYIGLVVWMIGEGLLCHMEYMEKRRIVWAFGGGDVLFLGLFAGYLGLAPLFSLFFLSLIARVTFALLQHWIERTV